MNPLVPRPPSPTGPAATLTGWLDGLTARVRQPEIALLAAEPGFDPSDRTLAAGALVAAARRALAERARILDRAETLRNAVSAAAPADRPAVLARHIHATVTNAKQQRKDVAALGRDLDMGCLLEREAEQADQRGALVEVAARALGGIYVSWWQEVGPALPPVTVARAFESTGALGLLEHLSASERRIATRRAAVGALAENVATAAAMRTDIDPRGLRLLRRLVSDPTEDPWVRRSALQVARGLEADIKRRWLLEAAATTEGPDAFLLRARAVELLLLQDHPWVLPAVEASLSDPSELVRFRLAEGLADRVGRGEADALPLLERILQDDPDPQVRAWTADALGRAGHLGLTLLADPMRDVPQVARYALEAAIRAARSGAELPLALVEGVAHVHDTAPPPEARLAGLALLCHQVNATVAQPVADRLADLRPGQRSVVELPDDVTALDLAEALVPHTFDGFGFQLEPERRLDDPGGRVRVLRGETMAPAAWRVLHELRHPAPAKRSGHSHAVGRADDGKLRVPPFQLAEESSTGVPGQRLRTRREAGWVGAVPMVQDYLHATSDRPITIVTSDGVTTIRPPKRLRDRLRAAAVITWRFDRLDRMRTAALESSEPTRRGAFVRHLKSLGLRTTHRARSDVGPSTPYFRSVVDPIAFMVSLTSNSLLHLAIVIVLLAGLLFGRLAWARRRLRRARRRLPLVIGGWGTRGKSGTERLKAGLLEGLGIPYVSKTTGCEAMFLHAPAGGRSHELFLFRPYDKATIWEQADVVNLANGLGVRSMLWECMALNPTFVELLQGWWMQDDIATLTNAYPDHEDIQGPTGTDVATVIGGFAPPGGLLVTTEQNMLPILREQAEVRGATMLPLRRAVCELVPRDLMDRFPHAEHPANVTLAAAVAQALGVPRTEAIGLMADHVVPDVGALVIYPEATYVDRRVVFANGMSANDTLSFRHNWRRVGFDGLDHAARPATWIVTVVNNRADRVARSRVFAHILAEDAAAHRHVIIGTNVRGLASYFSEAVAEVAANAPLDGPPSQVDALFAHLRIVEAGELGAACGSNLGAPAEAVERWRHAVAQAETPPADWARARTAAERLRPAALALQAACTVEGAAGLADHLVDAAARHLALQAARTAKPDAVRALYRDLAAASLIIVDDPGWTGDQSIHSAVTAAPPGAEVRILGVQNIKGTGLDFAYQWVYWRDLHRALQRVGDPDPAVHQDAMAQVRSNPLGSVLACDAALQVLADPAKVGSSPSERGVIAHVRARRDILLAARRGRGKQSALRRWLLPVLERLLDPIDAVWRRRRANLVLRDLIDRRISHARAQILLKDLTSRQKGGWLVDPKPRRHVIDRPVQGEDQPT